MVRVAKSAANQFVIDVNVLRVGALANTCNTSVTLTFLNRQ